MQSPGYFLKIALGKRLSPDLLLTIWVWFTTNFSKLFFQKKLNVFNIGPNHQGFVSVSQILIFRYNIKLRGIIKCFWRQKNWKNASWPCFLPLKINTEMDLSIDIRKIVLIFLMIYYFKIRYLRKHMLTKVIMKHGLVEQLRC